MLKRKTVSLEDNIEKGVKVLRNTIPNPKYDSLDPQRKILYDNFYIIIIENWKKNLNLNQDPHTIVRKIERSCYNRAINECKRDGVDRFWSEDRFENRYSVICSKLLYNMDPTSLVNINNDNPYYTIDCILNNKFNIDNISELSSYELNPQCNDREIAIINERKEIKIIEKISVLRVCAKCGARRSSYKEFQARSSDEPSNFKYTCLNCKHTWRE